MYRVDNQKSGRGTRAATTIGPALLLILATSGVVAKPTIGLEAARRQRAEAESREGEYERERQRSTEFERLGGGARLQATRDAVTAVIPERQSSLDVQNTIVLMARRSSVSVQTIEIGSPVETEFETIADRVLCVDVSLRGVGTLGSIVNFVENVQRTGSAAAVLECTLTRMQPSEPNFEFRITLSFHHRDALPVANDDEYRGDA